MTFDTLKFVEKLKAAGVNEGQAKAEAEALQGVFAEALDAQLATKAGIAGVERRVDALDAKMDARFERIDGKLTLVQWMLALVVAAEVMPVLVKLFQ
ncbi:MAG: DUF1640 domain-containing protein [Methylococcaceae bacterium]|nr:MAG: DUF1640 domain-containing protein [Methylococcaceae bacterium]